MARKHKKGKPGRSRAPKKVRTRPIPEWVWKLAELAGKLAVAALLSYLGVAGKGGGG